MAAPAPYNPSTSPPAGFESDFTQGYNDGRNGRKGAGAPRINEALDAYLQGNNVGYNEYLEEQRQQKEKDQTQPSSGPVRREGDESEMPAIFPHPNQHGAPTKPVEPDPHVQGPPKPPKPDPYRTPAPRPSEDEVRNALIALGLSVAILVTVMAALADPEPVSKLALAGLTAAEIDALLIALGLAAKVAR
jgi:hypothetical protein